jgi:SNF2 family DNA or RNA helicase
MKFCDQYWTGYGYKVGGIKDLEYFKQYTSDMMIRRERKDVLPELPDVNRVFFNTEVVGSKIRNEYIQAQKIFEEAFYEEDGEFQNILAKMSKLRHLAGKTKVLPCRDKLIEFLTSNESEKVIVFTHHIDVAELLEVTTNDVINGKREDDDDVEDEDNPLAGIKIINLVGKTGDARNNAVKEFTENPAARVMIASTLASGEGLNLQFVSHCIMLERQWNPANEEQAEARFPRPGRKCQFCKTGEIQAVPNESTPVGACLSCGLKDKIDAIYMIAAGTIDEFFTELVEQKREWIKSIHKETDYKWDESSLMKELASVLASNGMKKFKL